MFPYIGFIVHSTTVLLEYYGNSHKRTVEVEMICEDLQKLKYLISPQKNISSHPKNKSSSTKIVSFQN